MSIDALPEELRKLLAEIGRLAVALGIPAYLVGGAVRDLLLERPVEDVDLAVDGDVAALGRALAAALPAELRLHEAFGTASLHPAGGGRVDLARMRRESYATEAALPAVTPGTLREDLLRRDFTVNSLALSLEDLGYPELIDPSGGRADLAARELRVHHSRSFLDDPTRILRGVRLEARLGFGFEVQTELWAREAVASGVFEALSHDRLAAELALLFDEEADLAAMWSRVEDLGLLAALGFEPAPATPERLARTRGRLAEWRERYDELGPIESGAVLPRLVLWEQPPGRRAELAARLGLPPTASQLEPLDEAIERLTDPGEAPSRLNEALEELTPAELVLVAARGGDDPAAKVHEHLAQQRPLRLAIDGESLLAAGFEPGPRIGVALRATRDARLDSLIGPEEELAFALRTLRQGDRR